jgi:hypothetical protein
MEECVLQQLNGCDRSSPMHRRGNTYYKGEQIFSKCILEISFPTLTLVLNYCRCKSTDSKIILKDVTMKNSQNVGSEI